MEIRVNVAGCDEIYVSVEQESEVVVQAFDYPPEIAALYDKLSEASNYTIVGSLAERDSLPPSSRKVGLKCYVVDELSEFRLVGGIANSSWQLVKFDLNTASTTENLIFYVDEALGSDRGSGSAASPWQTIRHALRSIPSNIAEGSITISLGAGNYTITDDDILIMREFVFNNELLFQGTLVELLGGFTTVKDGTTPNRYNFNSGVTVAENQYVGKMAKSGGLYYPIASHGTDHIVCTSPGVITAIYEPSTSIILNSSRWFNAEGSLRISFTRANLVNGANLMMNFKMDISVGLRLEEIVYESNLRINLSGRAYIIRCAFLSSNNAPDHVFRTSACMEFTVENSVILHRIPAISRGSAITLSNSICDFSGNIIEGFAHAIQFNAPISNVYAFSRSNLIKNCGAAFKLQGSASSFINQASALLYIANVNYLFLVYGATEELKFNLKGSLAGRPVYDWFVPISGGPWGENSKFLIPKNTLPALIDAERGNRITYPE